MTIEDFTEKVRDSISRNSNIKGVLVSDNTYRWVRRIADRSANYDDVISLDMQVRVLGVSLFPSALMKDNDIKFIIA